jgi:hypothetical protein
MESVIGGWMINELEPHVALRLKSLFPRIPRHARVPFYLTGGPQLDADLSWFLQRYPLRMSAGDVLKLTERKTLFETQQAALGSILSADWKPTTKLMFRHNRPPYPYQQQAAEMCRRLGRLLLLDDVGMGKTISALATIAVPELLPAAIVVQPHLADQWKDEYIDAFTHLKAHIIKGTRPYELPPADIYIFRYTNIAGWVDYIDKAPFKSVIFDEIQELRHGFDTQKGASARAFLTHARLKMGLTATPIYNYGSEIFNIIEFLDPGALGTWIDFTTEWCSRHGTHWKVDDPPALGTHLAEQHLSLRRLEGDVGSQMPPVNTIIQTIPYDEEVAAQSEDLARQLALTVTRGDFMASGQAAREFNALMRHTTGVAKARHVAAFVKILLGHGRPVLLTGWHRDVYDIWMAELAEHEPMLFTGSESTTAKRKAKKAFMAGDTNLLIMSLRSGTGLDGLQERGSTVVFGELDWSPQVHKQVIGRLRRPGQTRQVDAIYLVTDGGSDPYLVTTLGIKADQSRGILDPLAGVEQQHTDASRIKELAELYLQGKTRLDTLPRRREPEQIALFGDDAT